MQSQQLLITPWQPSTQAEIGAYATKILLNRNKAASDSYRIVSKPEDQWLRIWD